MGRQGGFLRDRHPQKRGIQNLSKSSHLYQIRTDVCCVRGNYPKPLDEQAIMQLIFGQVVAKPVLLVVARRLLFR